MQPILDLLDLSAPGLDEVRAAATRGDQAAAGSALLAYYARHRQARCLDLWDPAGPEDYHAMPWGAASSYDQLWKNTPERVTGGLLYASGQDFDFSRDENIDWTSGIYWAGGKFKPVDQARALLRRMYWLRAFDVAYLRADAAGQERVARQFERLLGSWMTFRRWAKDEFSVTNAIRLGDAISQSGLLRSWFTFLPSPHITAEFKLRLLQAILEEAADALDRALWHPWIWGLSEAGGLALAGMILPEAKAAPAWRQAALAFANRFFQTELRGDGTIKRFHFCPHYAGATAAWPLAFYPLAAKLGYTDLLEPGAKQGVERLVDWLAAVQKPDDTVPQYNGSDLQGYGRWLATGATWFNRPDWLAIATAGTQGTPPAEVSRVLPDAGAFLLRDGFGRDAMFACLHNGDYHNVDRPSLAIDLCALGRTLVTAPGRYGYYKPEWEAYFTSAGYNTLLVDGSTPAIWGEHPLRQGEGLRDAAWHLGADVDWAWGTHPAGFDAAPEVRWQRGLLFAKGEYWLVVDRILGPGAHDFSLRWLLTPSSTAIEADGLSVHTDNPDTNVRLVPVVPPGTQLNVWSGHRDPLRGWFSPENGTMIPAPQLEYRWRGTAPVLTAMLIVPYRGARPTHALTMRSQADDTHEIIVTNGARTDRLTLDFRGAGSARWEQQQTGRRIRTHDLTP